jgi:hypothetical protein
MRLPEMEGSMDNNGSKPSDKYEVPTELKLENPFFVPDVNEANTLSNSRSAYEALTNAARSAAI